jgi:hypothetical protein
MFKTRKQLADERLSDPEQMKRDHKQFEKWIRGEVDEPPECIKIKDDDIIPENTDRVPENHPFKSMCGVALDQYIRKVTKKRNQLKSSCKP